jgi:uncharacterized membrane protein
VSSTGLAFLIGVIAGLRSLTAFFGYCCFSAWIFLYHQSGQLSVFSVLKLRSLCCRGAAHDLLGSMPVIVGSAFRTAYAFPKQLRDGADTVLIHFG